MKRCLVLGAGGFIGGAMVERLKAQGHHVVAVDLELPSFAKSPADKFLIMDLSEAYNVVSLFTAWTTPNYDEVFQFAADMGGAGYIFTGAHDADLMTNSALINLHVAKAAAKYGVGKLFYSSSACIYPAHIQTDPNNPGLKETDAWPANPDSTYGVEKIVSEKLYDAYARNYGLNVRIARFHNIFGPRGTFDGGREKAPAAICRKVALAAEPGEIEIWGDGEQTRSFLYIDDCLDGVQALMASECKEPVNIGSDHMVSINQLANLAMSTAGKQLSIKHIPGPLGVRGRNSDNTFAKAQLGWAPKISLAEGIEYTYKWIEEQLRSK